MTRHTRTLILVLCSVLVTTNHPHAGPKPAHYAIALYNHQPAFEAEARAVAKNLAARGYASQLVDAEAAVGNGIDIQKALQRYIEGAPDAMDGATWIGRAPSGHARLERGDRLFVALECDGDLNVGVYKAGARVDEHGFYVKTGGQVVANQNACWISAGQVLGLSKLAHDRGIELVIVDGSCSGGATTFLLDHTDACAISLTPPGFPAVQGTPALSQYLDARAFPFIKTFADVAVAGGLTILAQFPQREQQDAFYTTGGTATEAMTLRAAIYGAEQSLGAWDLSTTDVYPFLYRTASTRPGPAGSASLIAYLGGDSLHRHEASDPSLAMQLKRAANFGDILEAVMRTTRERWTAEDADLSAPPADARAIVERKERLFAEYRSGEFVKNPLVFSTDVSGHGTLLHDGDGNKAPLLKPAQIPATIQATHQDIERLVARIQMNQQPLADALQRLEARVHGTPPINPGRIDPATEATVDEILRLQTADEQMLPVLSKLLGILDLVEQKSSPSPCVVSIE